jgi:hypothetical protein
MYAVKVEHSKELKSWYGETPSGLDMAIEEAEMRTHASGKPHIVTDNHGLRLHLALPAEVKRRIAKAREERTSRWDWWLSMLGVAIWVVAIFYRR